VGYVPNTFVADLNLSQQGENDLANRFMANGWTVTTTQDKDFFSQYDLTVSRRGLEVNVEFKHDVLSDATGNACVEVSKTVNGIKKKSGLSATTAMFYVFKFGVKDDNYYAINTSALRTYIKNNAHVLSRTSGGDGGRSNLVLIPLDTFKKVIKPILLKTE